MTIEEENCAEKTNGFKPICRSDGVNESERYLKKLCDHSFLSLWSYSSIFRDQGKKVQPMMAKRFVIFLSFSVMMSLSFPTSIVSLKIAVI